MTYLIILGCLVLLPFLFAMALHAHGSIVFLSLCLGSVLATLVAPDVTYVVSAITRGSTLATLQWAQIGLLTAPFVLAALFTRGTIRGGKQLFNFITILASGALFALLITPYLSSSWQAGITSQAVWHQLDSLQTAILIIGASMSLLFLLMTKPHHKPEKKH